MKVLIAGGSGLVGAALTGSLRGDGHTVSRMVRPGSMAARGDVQWNPLSASVDGPTHLKQPPRVFVCASAIGFYGDRGDEVLTETSGYGNDFLSILCRAWEGEAARAAASGIRTVIMRFGIVLSVDGGALPRMLTPFKFGAGGRLGSGKQWMSWIALEDVVRVLRAAMDDASWNGPVNLVAPEPVRNSEFTRVLASVLLRPAIFPAPPLALRLALGEMADALLLSSQRVQPECLGRYGYAFRYENLEAALHAVLVRP